MILQNFLLPKSMVEKINTIKTQTGWSKSFQVRTAIALFFQNYGENNVMGIVQNHMSLTGDTDIHSDDDAPTWYDHLDDD